MDFHGRFSAKDHLFFFAFASLLESAILSAIAAVFFGLVLLLGVLVRHDLHASFNQKRKNLHASGKEITRTQGMPEEKEEEKER
ncbi:hypothetical protein BDA96_02G289100 [Sorghum bicolor]|jgi:hypothetical protein|uniref:Uncharacterized protein n=1 Tax=Sorghum bicolor TaxID=4558 RepID=A0A921RRQ1_SORBI|nr:hypothetical protein BDA96_02G289100 [Sorghum bicolor]